eukprot:TRINITY_DN482_c0_g1_i1.p1 TRINITY_DN482_c0_g1~~TRINITY_DN482_c0_g1_i1.p1  ORF type:complete len:1405 (+),score=647.89 TRINITY_DN482_c0_g1_i1:43-4215(+)
MSRGKKKPQEYDEAYEKLTLHEQVMHRPDTYVGSLEKTTEKMWVYNEENKEMELRTLTWVPALYKIFDEILVNAADNKERDKTQSKIKVDINVDKGFVKVWNNGEGIPVQMHSKHKIYIPDMIFGHLLTSSNYKDEALRTTGGRNGFGAKLANIFSTKFTVETAHSDTGKKFKKTWTDNMKKSDDPVITDMSSTDTDFTCITFWPDFKRFGMDSGFDDDTLALFYKRVVDVGGVTDKTLKVYLNGKLTPAQDFQSYVELFPGLGEEKMKDSYACPDERWQICIRPSNIDYQQISFVNSIWTIKGGKHVQYIVEQAVSKIAETISKKNKKVTIAANNIKPFLWVFVNAKIVNPAFDSQTKETLNTNKSKFGSKCEVPQKMIDALVKVISERVMDRVNNKFNKQMAAKVAAGGRSRFVNVPKLDDANDAGTKKGSMCTLILTEGDSAKSMVVSGLGKVGRDRYGVFPLRGKPLNVREASKKQIAGCKEIQNIMKIMGLKPGVKYTDTDQLRYGSVMIMTDQDHDGSHIKGLLINMFHTMWPELLAVKGFLVQFITPIVKGFRRGAKEDDGVAFFTIPDFVKFKEAQDKKGIKYDYKYYKGLGTSSTKEAKEYFADLDTHKVDFVYEKGSDDKNIELAFSKKMIEARKKWITEHKTESWVDYNIKLLGYSEFINKELILFSIADCERSIPSAIDGLKPGQRKVLYSAFKRNLVKEIKVAQFSGYVSEHGAYHHGEKSLQDTITAMAQNFTGGNNLPFLKPCGTFGSRALGGKDHASARYIFTKLDPVTRHIFPKVDDNLLVYKDDDGTPVEPEYYVPIIPTVLLNGQSGIGTGFATNIPNYNPADLISVTRSLINGEEMMELIPWYRGFTGKIKKGKGPGKFISEGVVEKVDSSVVRITELPVKYWTDDFKADLTAKQEKGLIIEFRNHITGDNVDVDVALRPEVLTKLESDGLLLHFFELRDHIFCSNLICFDKSHVLHKYATPEDIVKEWYLVRLQTYIARKKYLIDELTKSCEKLRNMVRFITEVNEGTMKIQNRKRALLLKDLQERKYSEIHPRAQKIITKTAITDNQSEGESDSEDEEKKPKTSDKDKDKDTGYEYLLGMKLWSLTYEKAKQLAEQLKNSENELEELKKKPEKDMWLDDLKSLETALEKANKDWEMEMKDAVDKKPAKGKAKVVKQTRLTQQSVKPGKVNPEAEKLWTQELARLEKRLASENKVGGTKRKTRETETDAGDEDEVEVKKKPRTAAAEKKDTKAKKPAAKKKEEVDDDDTSSESSDESDTSSDSEGSSNEDSESEDSDEVPAKKKPARKPAAKKASPKKASPKKASPKKASPKKASPKAAPKPAPKKRALKTLFGDDDSDDDIMKFDPSNFMLDDTKTAKKKKVIDDDSE